MEKREGVGVDVGDEDHVKLAVSDRTVRRERVIFCGEAKLSASSAAAVTEPCVVQLHQSQLLTLPSAAAS